MRPSIQSLLTYLSLLGCLALSMHTTCWAVKADPAADCPVPNWERYFFTGSYVYYGTHPVHCTLIRKNPKSQEFTVHWSAYWPTKDSDKWGDNDKGWYAYQGPLQLSSNSQVSGKAKYHKFEGSYKGAFPQSTFDLTYTGGRKNYEGARTIQLSPAKEPGPAAQFMGIISMVEFSKGLLQAKGILATKTNKKGSESSIAIVVTQKTQLSIDRRDASLSFLSVDMPVKVTGYKTEEGLLASSIVVEDTVDYSGTITSVRPENKYLTALVKAKRDRKAEASEQRLHFAHVADFRPANSRLKTMDAALASLTKDQRIDVGCIQQDNMWLIVWMKTREP